MPVYQYACTECGEQLEVRQSFTDEALTVCPACAGRLRKVLSAVGVVFKGSGFYRTDSRAAASGNGTNGSAKDGATTAPASDSGSGSSAKSEASSSKAETKSPASATS